jgi:hypothetical protein
VALSKQGGGGKRIRRRRRTDGSKGRYNNKIREEIKREERGIYSCHFG